MTRPSIASAPRLVHASLSGMCNRMERSGSMAPAIAHEIRSEAEKHIATIKAYDPSLLPDNLDGLKSLWADEARRVA